MTLSRPHRIPVRRHKHTDECVTLHRPELILANQTVSDRNGGDPHSFLFFYPVRFVSFSFLTQASSERLSLATISASNASPSAEPRSVS